MKFEKAHNQSVSEIKSTLMNLIEQSYPDTPARELVSAFADVLVVMALALKVSEPVFHEYLKAVWANSTNPEKLKASA